MRLFLYLFLLMFSSFANAQELDIEYYSRPWWPEPAAWVDESGNVTSLEDLKGKVVLLNVWATWCPPCVREMPQLDQLQYRYGEAGFEVVAISQDRLKRKDGHDVAIKVRDFYDRYRIEHLKVYHDPAQMVKNAYVVRELPTTYIINREGQVVARAHYGNWLSDTALATIQTLIQEGRNEAQASRGDSVWDEIFASLDEAEKERKSPPAPVEEKEAAPRSVIDLN